MEVLLQNKNMKRICLLILFVVWVWSLMAMPADSVGIKQISGQPYIVYQLSAGETVYALSRKYDVSYQSIAEANPGVDLNAMQLGQEILIPLATKKNAASTPAAGNFHIVAHGETVYNIAKLYTTDVNTLLKLNPEITNNTIKIGQVLHIPAQAVAIVQNGNNSGEKNSQLSSVDTPVQPQADASTSTNNAPQEITFSRPDKNKSFAQLFAEYKFMDLIPVSEKGVATWIEGSADMQVTNGRYYALNNQAPIGSIVKVRNLMNNREIYAKVIGTLSDTEVSEKILIKLSAGAAEQLNVLDARFVSEITHYEAPEEVKK